MRDHHLKIFKTFFHEKLFRRRADMGISQNEMANRLEMGCRTYVDLDHGKSSCGALTFALFLIYICDDPMTFLNDLRYALENSDAEV